MSDDPILAALARLEAGQKSLRTDFLDELSKTRAEIMGKIADLKGGHADPRRHRREHGRRRHGAASQRQYVCGTANARRAGFCVVSPHAQDRGRDPRIEGRILMASVRRTCLA